MKKMYALPLAIAIFASLCSVGQRNLNAPHYVSDKTIIKKGAELNQSKASLFESFESSFPPAGWIKANPDGGTGWAKIANGTTPLPGWNGGTVTVPAGGGNNVAYCTWSTGGASSNDQWLITPALDIVAGDFLTFSMQVQNANTYFDHVEILLSTTNNNTSSFTETIDIFDFNANLPWTEYTYDLTGYDGETVYIAFREMVADNLNDGAFVSLDLVQVGTLAAIDAALVSINTPMYAELGNIDITGTISNNGGDNITSYDVTYNIDGGGNSEVYNVSGISVALGGTHDFTHNVPCNFTSDGTYTIEVTISNVNGGGETNLEDNLLTKDIIIYSASVPRKIILENFTTGQCPNCPPIHVFLENYVANHPNAILIAQHAGFGTDPMTIPENTELLALYNAGGSTFAPALSIDRYHYPEGLVATPDPGPVFWPGESTAATTVRMNERLNLPSFVEVNINGTYNANGSLDLTIHGELVADVAGNDLRLVVYLLEDGLIYPQAGGTSNYVHNNVMRDAVSGTWGDAGIITSNEAGTIYSTDYSYTLNANWNADNMYVVAFVANYEAGNVNNREILNAEEVKITELTPVSIRNNDQENNISLYPNPATDKIRILNAGMATIEIYNIIGELLISEKSQTPNTILDVSSLSEGTYFIRVLGENSTYTEKLIISQ